MEVLQGQHFQTFFCVSLFLDFSAWGSVFHRDRQSGAEVSSSFQNVIFLFHEGMLTDTERSAIFLCEETFGQTERSQGTIATVPFLLQPSQGQVRQDRGLTASAEASGLIWGAWHRPLLQQGRDAGTHVGITQSNTQGPPSSTEDRHSTLPEGLVGW